MPHWKRVNTQMQFEDAERCIRWRSTDSRLKHQPTKIWWRQCKLHESVENQILKIHHPNYPPRAETLVTDTLESTHWNFRVGLKQQQRASKHSIQKRLDSPPFDPFRIDIKHHGQVGKHECAAGSWCHITWFIDPWFSGSKFSVTACSSSEPLNGFKDGDV